ncbi:hypothetical protein AB0471_25730 [Streptomyces sp. NPDC052002]|uniref:hypothetical protein n=1 Tax=Streptomyces sp. NPDC052002 TaxID=3155754 RepID=UPI00344C26F0
MSSFTIAEVRSEGSENRQLFMLAYSAGRSCAAKGDDDDGYVRSLTDPEAIAGFIEGLASWRAQTARPRDYVPYSAARRTARS